MQREVLVNQRAMKADTILLWSVTGRRRRHPRRIDMRARCDTDGLSASRVKEESNHGNGRRTKRHLAVTFFLSRYSFDLSKSVCVYYSKGKRQKP